MPSSIMYTIINNALQYNYTIINNALQYYLHNYKQCIPKTVKDDPQHLINRFII